MQKEKLSLILRGERMRVSFETEGNFEKIIKKLNMFQDKEMKAVLENIGREGVQELERATPRDTGETAASWDYNIKGSFKGLDLGFFNTGHPELSVNIALLKQVGHGTGTGGYVPPNDYIRPAMSRTFKRAGEMIAKELRDT